MTWHDLCQYYILVFLYAGIFRGSETFTLDECPEYGDPPCHNVRNMLEKTESQNLTHTEEIVETLPTGIFSSLEGIFSKYRVKAFVYIGVSAFAAFAFTGLACFFTYVGVNQNYQLQIQEMQDRFLTDISQRDGEIKGYRNVISAFSKRGRRKSLGAFKVTAYDPVESCKPFDDGITSVALPVGMGVAAVDPGVIPYGSVLYLPEVEKYFFACDTGAAMRREDGRNIDLLMPTVEEALEFGVKSLQVELIDLSD
jgi:3D (Asp-Asp-Asp) domain-containing protein